jgi:Mg-chelatase subunit ChlD
MKQDYTHLTVILDRSGSMESIRDDTIGGFNTFLKQQQAEPGTATLTLVQFDSQDPYEVIHGFEAIGKVPQLTHETFVPRGSTPLLDALGQGINDLGQTIAQTTEDVRPSKVIFVVVTDGQENASREFSRDQIQRMIKEKTEMNNWQFVFLSADLAALGDARSVGISHESSLLFEKSGQGSAAAWNATSARTSDYRSNRKSKMEFDEEDRKHPDDPEKPKS